MSFRLTDDAPIFLVGTGRCGSTIIYSVLAMHSDLAWISSWVGASGGLPSISVFNRIWELPSMDRFRETRFFPKPAEAMDLFSSMVDNYYAEALDANSLTQARERIVPAVDRIRHYQGKRRFVGKLVGRPVKVTLLSKAFPNAFFVHITRSLKPTVSSVMKVDFYTGWGSLSDWPWDSIPERWLQYYEQSGRAEEVGVAITVRLNQIELDRQLSQLDPSRRIDQAYDDFVKSPVDSIHTICDRAGLSMQDSLVERVKRRRLFGGADEKWLSHFSSEQVERLVGFEELAALES